MESVLSASRMEAGAITIERSPCDLADMINEVASNYREVNPGYEIAVDVETLPASFTADVKLLRQVVSNLVSNAVKYSPEAAHVSVKATSSPDGGVEITVQDQGVGIPADELDKLFKRFFRASTSTGIAGTGIGLHMVKTIVGMHGGRIDVASEKGVGTTFTVHLPSLDDDAIINQEALSEVA
jgi:signal transduction histidine kinase